MLSVFPSLYNYSFFVPAILRLFLAIYLFRAAYGNFLNMKVAEPDKKSTILFWTAFKALGAILMLLGLFIQPAALLLAASTLAVIFLRKKHAFAQKYPAEFYWLLIAVYVTLALLGPGPWSIDLPL
jgi:uncharacterized membrane protein YphA (DoxX/SURF4 family)